MPTKSCQHCGVEFFGRLRRTKFCSRACSAAVQSVAFRGAGSAKYTGGAPEFTCRQCSSVFTRFVAAGGAEPVYCCRECMTAAYSERFVGEGNPAWRGG